MMRKIALGLLGTCLACTGTTDPETGRGNAQVFIEAEEVITLGLDPGTTDETIQDGWTVRYDRFLIAVGNFRATQSSDSSQSLSKAEVYVVDLKNVPAGGFVFAEFNDVPAVRYDRVGYDIPNASASALQASGTSQADYDLMVQNGYSIYVEATLTKPDGESCTPGSQCVVRTTQRVRWGLAAGTSFDDCAPEEGDSGFAVPAGGTVQVKPTIHGDHWFFTNITQGAELTERRAQWIVDSDLNADGETTLAELEAVDAADVFPSSIYNLSGGTPINTAYDYLLNQARTLGDFQGHGECPTRRAL